jgi:cytochrome c-type biogenesis protein CcmH
MARFLIALFITLLVGFIWSGSGFAQSESPEGPTDDEVNAIAKQLYCPVCENIPLDVCGTQACAQWRELIRDKLGQGWNELQVKQYFVDQYGDRVLATPPVRGFNWLAYVIPPLAILAGVFVLARAFQAWRRPAAAPAAINPVASNPAMADDYVARLEEELRNRK